MDQGQHDSYESSVNLTTLPTELLVYIISYLSSIHDKTKLRFVLKSLRGVVEGTPSLWKKFVWPYFDSNEECRVKELLKVCGQHIKVLSFPNCRSRMASTMVEMLQYCSNVQHLSLPSTRLDPEQLRKTIHYMKYLQKLEVRANATSDVKCLLQSCCQLKELTITSLTKIGLHLYSCHEPIQIFKLWKEMEFRPSNLNVIAQCALSEYQELVDYVPHLATFLYDTNAVFRMYNIFNNKVPLDFSPTLPEFQMQIEGSGQWVTPCVKLSNFGILGLENQSASMTDCQYGESRFYMVRCCDEPKIVKSTICDNLYCVTYFNFSNFTLLHSGHLEQLAIACPNLHRLNLDGCDRCLNSLQGLQAIASHCHNLQGLNIDGICASALENHILLWKILSGMKLSHLQVEFCILRATVASKEKLICLYQECQTIRGILLNGVCECERPTTEDILMVSHFPSLNYCYLAPFQKDKVPTIVEDVINNCKELRCVCFTLYSSSFNDQPSLKSVHYHNLQQLYIDSPFTDVPDDFMTSISSQLRTVT